MKKIVLFIAVFFFWGCIPNRPFDQDYLTPVPVKESYISLQCNSFFISRIGSAVLIGNGYAITNRHLVEGARKVKGVMAGGIEFFISEITLSDKFDLALLMIPLGTGEPITMGKRIETGEHVYSVGTTYKSPILEGIVRESEFIIHHEDVDFPKPYGRDDEGRAMTRGLIYEGAFQKGFSGGPIVNAQGELVGINLGYIIKFLGNTYETRQVTPKSYGVGYHMADILGEINEMLARSNAGKSLSSPVEKNLLGF